MTRALICALLMMIGLPFAAADEYRLQPGDLIEFNVANYAELKQRVPVQMDGSLALPLVGALLGALLAWLAGCRCVSVIWAWAIWAMAPPRISSSRAMI